MYDGTPDNAGASTAETPNQTPETSKGPQTFEELAAMSDNLDQLTGVAPEKTAPKKQTVSEDEGDFEDDEDDEEELEFDDEDEVEDSDDSDDAEESEEGEDGDEDEDSGEIFLKTKVNGEMREFTKEQVTSMIASGWHTLEKSKQVEAEREQLINFASTKIAEIEEANEAVSPIWEAVKKKDIQTAVVSLAEKAGLDTLEVKRGLVNQIAPLVYQRLGLPPEWVRQRLETMKEQNNALDLKEQNEHLEQQAKKLQEASKPKAPSPEDSFTQELTALQVQHGISNAERQKAIDFIEAQRGNVSVTPEYIANVAIMQKNTDRGVSAIFAVKRKLAKDPKFVDMVVNKVMKNPDWSNDKLVRWVGKKARETTSAQRMTEKSALQRDISRKALKQPKSRFENSNAGQQKPQRFEDVDPDTFDLP